MRLPFASTTTTSNPARAFSATEPSSKSGLMPIIASWVRTGISTFLSVVRPPGSWIEIVTVAFNGSVVSARSPTVPVASVEPLASVSGTVIWTSTEENVSSTRPN